MDDLLSPDKVGTFLQFVLPGVLILWARNLFMQNRRLPVTEAALGYLVLSLVYQACLAYVLKVLDRWGLQLLPSGWFAATFVVPLVLGFLSGLEVRKAVIRRALLKLDINLAHPTNSAWDHRFGGCEECWVMAVLKDGTEWSGRLGPSSFAASNEDGRDLYIETVYDVGEGDQWTARASGVWLSGSEIVSLEFWPIGGSANGGQAEQTDQHAEQQRATG